MFGTILCDCIKLYGPMERTWASLSKKLNTGILSAVMELGFEQMTPVQVKSRFIALSYVLFQ